MQNWGKKTPKRLTSVPGTTLEINSKEQNACPCTTNSIKGVNVAFIEGSYISQYYLK